MNADAKGGNAPRLALVTGAAKRLGREIALALANAGWDIAVHFHQSQAEAEQTAAAIRIRGRRAVCFQCDLSQEAEVNALLPAVRRDFGPVHCIVNNASLFDYDGAENFTVARLDAHMHTNLCAPILLAQGLHSALPEDEQGVVINLLDQKLYNLNPDFLSYTLSKAALQHATTMLAQALAPKVRIVGVAPGLTLISHMQTSEEFAAAHGMSPLGESSRPEEVAQAVVFAAQNRALTGSTMLVDGGQHLVRFDRDFSMMNRNK
jgi:NAD(P)-dependent dehydrogenase (short-subunit alcohol dehydrogenase family)